MTWTLQGLHWRVHAQATPATTCISLDAGSTYLSSSLDFHVSIEPCAVDFFPCLSLYSTEWVSKLLVPSVLLDVRQPLFRSEACHVLQTNSKDSSAQMKGICPKTIRTISNVETLHIPHILVLWTLWVNALTQSSNLVRMRRGLCSTTVALKKEA